MGLIEEGRTHQGNEVLNPLSLTAQPPKNPLAKHNVTIVVHKEYFA